MRKLYVISILGSLGISACSGEEGTSTPPPPPPPATGGTATGGTATGGVSTGGTSTGGVATGGVATGGVGTGGSTGGAPVAGGGAGGAGGAKGGAGGAPIAGGGAGGAMGGGGAGGGGVGGATAGGGGKGGGGAGGAVGGAAGGGSGGGATVTFGQVADLLGKRCANPSCHDHDGSEKNHTNFSNADSMLRMRLLGMPPSGSATACRTQTLVVPNMPEKSLLIAKLGADNGPRNGCGDRMPLGCTPGGTGEKACLSDSEIMTIRSWIAAGAPQ